MPRGQSFEQAQVLRRDAGYHSYRLGADIAEVVRIPVQRLATERDNNTDVGP